MRQKVYNSTTSTWEYVDSSPPVDTGVVQSSTTAKLTTGPTAPASPAEGDVWVDTNPSMLKLSETAVGIGKDPENGALDVDGDIYSNGEKVKVGGGFKVGIIPGSTFGSTGNKAITGVGFKPKMVEFEVMPTNSTTSLIIQGRGAMDENGTQYTVAYSSSISGQARRSETNLAMVFMGQTTSITAAMGFEYVSMDEDGFTVNVLASNGTFDIAYRAHG